MPSRELNSFEVFDFRRGLDLKSSPQNLALSKGQSGLRKADHMVYTRSGGVTKRFDFQRPLTSSVGASVGITGGIQFRRSNGTNHTVFGTNDGNVYELMSDGSTTTLATGLTTGKTCFFAQYNDLLIFCNRADTPKKWDGTTWGTLGGSPPATGGPVTTHGNRVHFLDATQKSRWTWSALNNEEDYTTASDAGSTVIAENDGNDLMNLVPGINELIAIKGNRPYRIQGTSPSTYAITSVVPTTGSVGSISHTGAIFAGNDVWYLSLAGLVALKTVLSFGDLQERFASERISPYFEPDTDYTLSLLNLGIGVTCYDSQNNRVYVAVDTDADAQNDLILVYDLNLGAWSPWPGIAAASMWPVRNSTNGRVEIYAGGYDGHIRILNRNVSTNAIDGHVRHLSALGKPGVEKSPRYGYLYLKEEGDISVTVDTKFDFGATGGQTYSVSLNGGSGLLGVSWTLGEDPLGEKEQIVKRIDMAGTGEFVEIGVRNQNAGETFTLYGYEILWRNRRQVRRGTAA